MRITLLVSLVAFTCCAPGPDPALPEQPQPPVNSPGAVDTARYISTDEVFGKINLQEIKKVYASAVTSGVLGRKASHPFADPNNPQSFGTYFFSVDGRRPALRPYAIKATVSFIGEWKYDTKEERLLEIVVYASGILSESELDVGQSAASVIQRVGKPSWATDGCMFFAQGSSVLTVKMENDSVAAYKVGRYAVPADSVLFQTLCSEF